MESIAEVIENFFLHEEIPYEPIKSAGTYEIGFAGTKGLFRGYVSANEESHSILIEMFVPVRYPRERRSQVIELLAIINQRLLVGNFELGIDRGTIAFRTSVVLGQANLHEEIIRHLLFANWSIIDRWFPAISAVVLTRVSPKEAISIGRRRKRRSSAPEREEPSESVRPRLRNIADGSEN
jgi:hypothetical protein